jgi:hypothetical protein
MHVSLSQQEKAADLQLLSEFCKIKVLEILPLG